MEKLFCGGIIVLLIIVLIIFGFTLADRCRNPQTGAGQDSDQEEDKNE
jgi:predicted small secreted protein